MLLYTRLAAPKQPKRRSRGGTWKKKCDEKRPKCSRCEEQGVECAYEAVKPRQRRRRDSVAPGSPSGLQPMVRRLSQTSHYSHDTDYYAHDHGVLRNLVAYAFDDPVIPSPSDSSFEGYSLSSFTPNELSDCHHEDAPSEDGRATASTAMVPRSKSLYPDLAMIAPCPIGSPLLDFCAPTFSEFSDKQNRRALVDHFCNVLSHLIVFREETGNPFQQLVLPLTRRDSPVTYAIFALACAHLEYRGVENAEKSLYFHNMAIRGVAQLIQHSCKVNRNEILAAIMLLVYYECAFRFYDVITALSNGTPPLSATPTPGCLQPVPPLGAPSISPLCNVDTLLGMATTLWPIIHRLAGLRALKTELENAGRTNRNPSKTAVLRTEFESTAQAIETALLQWQPQLPPNFTPDPDPDVELMTATTPPTETTTTAPAPAPAAPEVPDPNSLLFPIDPDLITTTATTTTDTDPDPFSDPFAEPLSGTTAPSPPVFLPPSPSPQEWSRLSSIYHNALAYRHAALVYLYRTVLSHARMHAAVQAHARLALAHCVSTVRHRGPMSALLWPLFVSACEAVSPQDRALAERAFVEIDKRQGMRNIDRAWGILGEVWRRGDEEAAAAAAGEEGGNGGVLPPGVREDGEELWRRVCREMGVSIVFG
ncbi:fungal-specific transcription factor domain-containing protein [Corynascus novoguineensis]|uniref:Fungal-specific transcription factor domain-containing protein n=1 Tax=Corynascus novoguineensis TaxID=1126955 RepID=A0AAN7D0W9_9PEZI|nr:fungal-specific transcription factor domain-containing protein [Corynascus novoguineensis]